jgi:DNA-binding response OmpR family regulator
MFNLQFLIDPDNFFVENNISPFSVGKSRPVILVVDDSPLQALTRKEILNRSGLEVRTAYSAEAAFDALETDENREINLVITDHIMPGESGHHFVERLWERRAGLSVMVLSGLAEAEAEYEGLDITFRSKPILPSDLVALAMQLSGSGPTKL